MITETRHRVTVGKGDVFSTVGYVAIAVLLTATG
jgi:hypothetical protein